MRFPNREPKQNEPEESSEGSNLQPQTASALLSAIVESSDDAIITKGLDGTITSWNRAAERIYGYSAQEVIGRSIHILLPPDRHSEIDKILWHLRRGEGIDRCETTRLTKDGRVLNVSVSISPIRDGKGNIVGAATVTRDLTQVRMAEQALRNSEKLAVAGRMASMITHEISNPLETISDILYLLAQSPRLDDLDRTYLQLAQAEVQRLSEISKVWRRFYRGGERNLSRLAITGLLDGVLALYEKRIQAMGITLVRRYDSPGTLRAVSSELHQVFSNLILNATDALADRRGELYLHVCDSRDWRNPHRRGVRVSIADSGSGVRAEARPHLFEAFYSTKGEHGTGIGLWIARTVIQKHGGSIRMKSSTRSGHSGTLFHVFLPADPEEEILRAS